MDRSFCPVTAEQAPCGDISRDPGGVRIWSEIPIRTCDRPEIMIDALTDQPANQQISRAAALTALFLGYSRAARGTATQRDRDGDQYGQTLADARTQVYREAADLVRLQSLADAAQQMLDHGKQSYVRTPPLIDFDGAGVQYVIGRAWQFCAWQIDPTLPVVAPSWT